MTVPTKYNPSYSYTGFESVSPASPKPGAQLDNDFAQIEQSIDELVDALGEVRRSDGALANGVVGPDQLSAALVMGFTIEGQWTDGTVYDAADGVTYGTSFYKARVGHTAAPATRPDLSPTTWAFLFTFDSIAVGDNAVTTVKLADGAVTTVKIADGAVTAAKIGTGEVSTGKLADLSVTTAKLVDANVTTAKIADANVTTAKIADANVTGAKLADASVDTVKIVDAAVTFAKMATAALTSIYSAARAYILPLANTWTGVQTISTNALDLAVGQIKFPATANPSANANTLDDYEEGTFTPAFSATGCTFSYASQLGFYTKIGNRVFVDIRIDLNTSGNTLTANPLSITGLPFAASSSITNFKTSIFWSVSSTNYVKMGATLTAGGTTLAVGGNTVASGSDPGPAINANTALLAAGGSSMNLHFCYFV